MKSRATRKLVAFFVALGLFSSVGTGHPTQIANVLPEGLASVFERGPILQDRNGDNQVDFVSARLILPDNPTSEDVAAAVAVAARLNAPAFMASRREKFIGRLWIFSHQEQDQPVCT